MSKSLSRVRDALAHANLPDTIHKTEHAHTAQLAADQVGCDVDQIGKSIIFQIQDQDRVVLFLTAGSNQVDLDRAQSIANAALVKADAATVRAQTGFAIGGVSPIGHLNPIDIYMDPRLLEFDVIWVAAGTPTHVFSADPTALANAISVQVSNFTV